VGRPEGKRPLIRPRHRWVDNIEIYLREIGWGGRDWIDLPRSRDGCFVHGNESSGSTKYEILE
jgi:hypothetical protein